MDGGRLPSVLTQPYIDGIYPAWEDFKVCQITSLPALGGNFLFDHE